MLVAVLLGLLYLLIRLANNLYVYLFADINVIQFSAQFSREQPKQFSEVSTTLSG